MVHALQTKASCNEDYMAIKTEMSKTYDRVDRMELLGTTFYQAGV